MSFLTGKSTWDGGDVANQNQEKADNMRNLNIAANRSDQYGPGGSIVFGKDANGNLTQTTNLAPGQQTLWDNRTSIGNNLSGAGVELSKNSAPMLSQPIDMSGAPGWQNVIGSGATNLMTHDWLANSGNYNGSAVAAAGSPESQSATTGLSSGNGVVGGIGGYSGGGGPTVSVGQLLNQQASQSTSGGDPYKVRDTFDKSGVTTTLPSSIDDASRKRVEEALFSRLNPQLANDESALRTRLLNSGIEVGSDAYNREMNLFGQKSNDARMQAVLAGGQEEDRQTKLLQGLNDQQFQQALATGKFGQDADITMANNATSRSNANTSASATLGAAGIASAGATERQRMALDQQSKEFNVNTGFKAADFNNNLRNQYLGENIALRREPLTELGAMSSLSTPQVPTYSSSYYTNSAQPAVQGAPQQQNSGNGLFDVIGGANKMWNMAW